MICARSTDGFPVGNPIITSSVYSGEFFHGCLSSQLVNPGEVRAFLAAHRYSNPHQNQTRHDPESWKKDRGITCPGRGIDCLCMDDRFIIHTREEFSGVSHGRTGIHRSNPIEIGKKNEFPPKAPSVGRYATLASIVSIRILTPIPRSP